MSIMHCDRCAHAVDTDYDLDTLYETEIGWICPECADEEKEYHPQGTYCPGYEEDDVIASDNAQRCADINEVLRR